MQVLGIDFTCAPRRAKPITGAVGSLDGLRVAIERVERIEDFAAFERLLATPGPWVAAFDFPFGLPRALVTALHWPASWPALVRHFASLSRDEIAGQFDAFRAAREPGRKYAHRAGDAASGAHSSMKLVNPPVAWMLHAGAPRLLAAGVHLPAVHDGDRSRVALEAYPGLVMRRIAASRGLRRAPSYKNDVVAKQTDARTKARRMLVGGLAAGDYENGVALSMPPAVVDAAIRDATGDTIDALAAAAQAAWGAMRADARYGLPEGVDRLEGWIVTA